MSTVYLYLPDRVTISDTQEEIEASGYVPSSTVEIREETVFISVKIGIVGRNRPLEYEIKASCGDESLKFWRSYAEDFAWRCALEAKWKGL